MRRVGRAEDGLSLSVLLQDWLASRLGGPVPRSRVRALILAGEARVDAVPLRAPGRPLRAGQRIEARLRPDLLLPRRELTDRPFRLTNSSILFRDRTLLVVSKPAGLPTHATADPGRPHLVRHVQELLAREGKRPYVAVHQRLDRDTSGIVLFAIDPAANAGLTRSFESREIEKSYLALTTRPPCAVPDRQQIEAPLARTGSARATGVGGRGAREALTEVLVRERLPAALLVEARPHGGRRHQVRAHLAHAGLPVLGDEIYGAARGRSFVPRLMLHAWRLRLAHPLSGRVLDLESPLPEDFRRALEGLRQPSSRPSGR